MLMRVCAAVLLIGLMFGASPVSAESPDSVTVIVVSREATSLENLAAKEVRRYVYLRTGRLLRITTALEAGNAIVVAHNGRPEAQGIASTPNVAPTPNVGAASELGAKLAALRDQDYWIRSVDDGNRRVLYIIGGGELGTLYGAYRFAEHLGVRFYMHGDVVPDVQIPFAVPQLDDHGAPLFDLRGIQPFHDFPEGPDWWNTDDYKAIIGQLPKMRMNFIGLHTYPEDRPNAEPTVWIGREQDAASDGAVRFGYPAIYYNTALPVGWGFEATKTSDYHFGGAGLFDRDDYGSDIMRDLTPRPETPEQCCEVFNRTGLMLREAFCLAHALGVKICVGTETPLVVPRSVRERGFPPEPVALKPVGGQAASFTAPIERTDNDPLYQTVRYDLQAYQCAVPNGVYTVTLKFCEPAYDSVGARVFGVNIEGKPVINSLDIFASVGKNTARDDVFGGIQVSDGQLDIEFVKQIEYPCIAAIAIEGQEVSHKVNCGGPAYAGYEADEGFASLSPAQIEQLYAGMFRRTMAAYPIDYYWFWTPEGWTWEGTTEDQAKRTIDDIAAAQRAAKWVNAPFQLATSGWVLGPSYDRALFDTVLPKDMPVSCINRQVGHEPAEPGFASVQNRPKWAIPWLEDDPAMTSPQLWVSRMRRDARDALDYGCTGLMGIHWRTRILGPNVSALAQAAWDQSWRSAQQRDPGAAGTEALLPCDDFYQDWALNQFGAEVAGDAARIFAAIDGKLPRASDWIGGPGGYTPDERPWEEVQKAYAFVDEMAALQARVVGNGNRERFDYWLNNLQYLRSTGHMRCAWNEFNKAMAEVNAQPDAGTRQSKAREIAAPAYSALVKVVEEAYRYLLATVNTSGEMGTVANLEQHTFPALLRDTRLALEKALGESLPAEATPSQEYTGAPRLIVPTVRTAVWPGESLAIKAIVLDKAPAQNVTLYWRVMGAPGAFKQVAFTSVARGTFRAEMPWPHRSWSDIEYYVEATTADGTTLCWPATAPTLNQTVLTFVP